MARNKSKEVTDEKLRPKHSKIPVILLNGDDYVMEEEPLEWQIDNLDHKNNMQMDCFKALPEIDKASTEGTPPILSSSEIAAAKPESTEANSEHSLSSLPVWTKIYYNRASICLAETAHRSSLSWSKFFGDDDSAAELNDHTSNTAATEAAARLPRYSIEPDQVLDFSCAGLSKPVSARGVSSLDHANRTQKCSWRRDDQLAFERPPGYHEKSSMLLEPSETAEEARLMHRLILIFAFGFLFPPLWLWGCLLSMPEADDKVVGPGSGERHIVERVRQWKFACAIMLGMSAIFFALCIGVLFRL